ncbi:MAG: DUF134 domain-containing protein [Candidatus Heimdallarchaeota archaeon]|nr:MAG: DUF134 domain-containing protein [Candidatus Heimdallarchaeota archaeon]
MRGSGGHGGRRKRFRGGRPKVQPFVGRGWQTSEGEFVLTLSNVELEALRLVDEENLTQEQAAEKMHISRGTLWRILQQARKKIILALSSGKTQIQLDIDDQSE